jgi:hypothetical protein
MDDVIAVRVALENGEARYFVTYGRIQEAVDPEPVSAIVLNYAESCSLGGKPMSASVCTTLREAGESSSAPYFYECLIAIMTRLHKLGPGYDEWRATIAAEMGSSGGPHIAYCGNPLAARQAGGRE